MSTFEFAFGLFSLLLGLSLAEILGGFARSVEARRSSRLGWLTPLLAIFVLMDIISFWGSAWLIRDEITISFPFMLGTTSFAGAYYVGAYLVFPRKVSAGDDLDSHYQLVRRPILGIIAAANVVQFFLFLNIRGRTLLNETALLITFAVFLVLCIANMFTSGKRAMPAMLAITVTFYFFSLLM